MFGIDDLATGDVLSAGASIVGGLLGFSGQQDTNSANIAASREQMAFQERMSSTAYQRAVKDMEAAGLNPMLAYSQGGASTPGGSMPVIGNANSAGVSSAASALQAVQAKAQVQQTEAQTENIKADTALKAAQVGATTASANHLSTQVESLKQQIDAWTEFGRERGLIARDNEWFGAARQRLSYETESKTQQSTIDAARHQASLLATKARIMGLDVPRALNEAAFENSSLGKSSRYVDFGTTQAGKVVNSATSAKRAFSPAAPANSYTTRQDHGGGFSTSTTEYSK